MAICKGCENMLDADYKVHGVIACIYSSRIETDEVQKCTHFKAKPKDNKELQSKEQKALEKKGQTIDGIQKFG